ncbi:MAG: hypothetical protein ACXVZQ_12835, partial [Terriglobales bacterium]
MYLTYADDSGSDKKAPRIVIGAALIRHEFIQEIESVAGMVVERIIPDDRLDKFEEFHACELFAGEGIFEGIDREVRKQALIVLLRQVSRFNIPFIYSAVDKKKLTTKALGSANPIDVAFRMCALGVEEWIKVNDGNALALLICDDTNDQGLKRELRNSFRSLRP